MIAVFSGTKDGRILIEKLLTEGFKVMAFTATEYGEQLIEKKENLKVHWGKLDEFQMEKVFKSYPFQYVIDATHPYAEGASKSIITSLKDIKIPYLRFERKIVSDDTVTGFDSYDLMLDYLSKADGNILLTIGSNNIDIFVNKLDLKRLYFRILPTSSILKRCENLGIRPWQIIAVQGPFTKAMNLAMYEAYNIQYVISKDSGDEGGVKEKISAAKEKNIEVLMLGRPKIDYPNVFNDMNQLIEALKARC